ncbi:MAG: ribonuclease P protein component [Candidatus Pacebacteria bacterium]|nr:ribonuclease P protein component [Candidatus Paceibacterota bacterium]
MFPKINRFETRLGEDFFANAKRAYSPLFVLYYQKRDDNQVKVTVIVPKKNVFKATDRSKIKRKMRSSLIPHLGNLEGLNLVLYLKSRVTENNINNFEKEIDSLVKKFK